MAHKSNPLHSTLSLALATALLLSTLSLSACTDDEAPSSSGSSVSGMSSPDVTSDTSPATVSTTPTVSFTFTEDLSPMPASEGLELTLLDDGTVPATLCPVSAPAPTLTSSSRLPTTTCRW